MKSFRKIIASTALVVVGSMSVATMASAESINGTGATFPQNFQASASAEYNKLGKNEVTYANPGGGSSTGKNDFFANTTKVAFAGTDSAVSASKQSNYTASGWVYVPYVAGAIAVAYRLDALNGATLNLSIPTVAGIFNGTIKKWNDPLILADMKTAPIWVNSQKKSKVKGASALWTETSTTASTVTVTLGPLALKAAKGKKVEVFVDKAKKSAKSVTIAKKGSIAINLTTTAKASYTVKVGGKEVAKFAQQETTPTLPDKAISVVYRSDGSGTTNNFIKPLNAYSSTWAVNDDFKTAFPGGSSAVAALGGAFQGQSGSANVSNYIAANDGSIGYTEISFVTERADKGMKAASIKNVADKFVAPTAAATSSMISASDIDAKGFVTFNYKQTTNTTAYPFVAITYALGRTAVSDKALAVADYLSWILNTYAPASAESLGYAPLTGAVLTIAKNNAARIGSGN